jgi:hypothetical protein
MNDNLTGNLNGLDELNMILRVKKSGIVGELHPVCRISKLLCNLTGKKMLTSNAMSSIRKLGYSVRLIEEL